MGWVLFIDESGDFDSETERACVGGLLAPRQIFDIDRKTWHAAFGHAVWPEAWPPHAAELNKSGGIIALWLQSGRRWVVPGVDPSVLHAAEHVLRQCNVPKVAPFLRAAEKRHEMPDWELVCVATVALGQHPAIAAQLSAGIDRIHQTLALLVSGLGKALGSRVVVPMAVDVGSGLVGHDRYALLLQALIERSVQLISAAEPEALELSVATRGVLLPEVQARSLNREDVLSCVQGALANIRHGGLGNVQVTTEAPLAYDEGAPPGLVLADWICNRARNKTWSPRSWPTLRDTLHRELGVTTETFVAPLSSVLPSFSAAGPESSLPGWAKDVDRIWRQALARSDG